jgi:hypothetical protein
LVRPAYDATRDEELRAVLAHNRDEEKEHAAMVLEWLRRHDAHLDQQLRNYLFTGKPILEREEELHFMTGFLVDNNSVWGRPAGVAITRDGALLVSDDANGTIFRVTQMNAKLRAEEPFGERT